MIVKRLTIITELVFFLSNNLCCSLNDTHAIILARGGSKGIKNKNLIHFDGKTLLGRTIVTIKNTGYFHNIWVSTDSDDIAKEALKHDVLVYRRLEAFAQDHSSSLDAIKEFLYKNKFVRKFALFQCTSVFLKEEYIIEAFNKFQHQPCVFAATRSHKLRWKIVGAHLVLPLNFDPTKRPRRQDWEGEFEETGMFYFSTKELVKRNSLQNHRCVSRDLGLVRTNESKKQISLYICKFYPKLLELLRSTIVQSCNTSAAYFFSDFRRLTRITLYNENICIIGYSCKMCEIVEISSTDAIEIDELNDVEMAKCMLQIRRSTMMELQKQNGGYN